MPTRKKINFPIFLKLIALIIIFIVLVNLSIGYIVRMSIDEGPFRPPMRISYLFNDYFIKDIGNPPDTLKARAILSQLGTKMRYETSKSNWASSEDVPRISELRKDSDFEENKKMFSLRKKYQVYEVMKLDDGYIIFVPPPFPRDDINLERAIVPLIICITLLASLLYFSLRWIFGPVKKLSAAVGQISHGNFDVPIDIKRKDELGNLADAINEMKYNISNMIKAKESLLIDVSHELRSPLTRIKLANEFVEDEKIKNKIRDDIKEMEAMITGLLETYRMENIHGSLKVEKADIINLTKKVILKFDSSKINFSSQFEKREINIDKEKIEVALRNIIDNALKYSNGKTVDININENPVNTSETLISVKDYGKGIKEEELQKIFEPFYRVDKSRDKKITGYGLGLSIVKKILDLHNFTIEINSKLSFGTEFKIILKAGKI